MMIYSDLFAGITGTMLFIAIAAYVLTIAESVFGIISSLNINKQEETQDGTPIMVLSIIGIFVPVCAIIAMFMLGIYSLQHDQKGKGIAAVILGAASIVLTIAAVVFIWQIFRQLILPM